MITRRRVEPFEGCLRGVRAGRCVGKLFSVRLGLFLAIGKPKHLCGSDRRSLESGHPQRFLAFRYKVNFLTLALTWPWDHQLSEFSYAGAVGLCALSRSNRFRRYLRCKGYCSATRRRSFQHQWSGTKTRRQLVNRTSSDCESSRYVGTGTPVAEKSKLTKLHKT